MFHFVLNKEAQAGVAPFPFKTLKRLYKLKDFLRKNSKSKVNSYEFTNNSDLIAGFGCSEIKYNEITSVVKAHSINCDNF